jgi:glycosyltransferase involved in cell wall biosynthesis
MSPEVSVIISTHNPHSGRLKRTLKGIRAQTLPRQRWELIIVDNASKNSLQEIDAELATFTNANLVREERLGLTFGRLAGIRNSRAPVVVFIDDDNVMDRGYLKNALSIFRRHPRLGLAGGKSIPEWAAVSPEPWVEEFNGNLALRDLGEQEETAALSDPPSYPRCAPIGAGMMARRRALDSWMSACVMSEVSTGRRGRELTSGEDCDIVMYALRDGWEVGYFPELRLTHLIPAERLTRKYLARLNYGIARSWVQVLARHEIRPWPPATPWTVPIRKVRAYLSYHAWAGPAEHVRWRGACGQFDGRAKIK